MTRSELMARIRSSGTDPERRLAAIARACGLRCRANVRSLPGTPDLANKSRRIALLAHGCFWHQHRGCGRMPSSNLAFWRAKLEANVRRDRRVRRELRALGYTVVVAWECDLRRRPGTVRKRLLTALGERH